MSQHEKSYHPGCFVACKKKVSFKTCGSSKRGGSGGRPNLARVAEQDSDRAVRLRTIFLDRKEKEKKREKEEVGA